MNKKNIIILLVSIIVLPLGAEDTISRFEKTKLPSRLKKSRSSIQRVDMVSTATTAQMTKSAPKKVTPTRKRWVIDKIVRRVNGANILQSDLNLPRISKEGGRYTLEELTMEELLIQKAGELHMLPTPADIERQLVTFKIQNNLTGMREEEFEDQLKESGFSLIAYKTQLGRLIASENVRRVELSERLVITSQEVEKFYENNPSYLPEAYHLSICTIPADKIKNAQEFIASHDASWHDLGLIEKEEIGENFSFVLGMQTGQISKPFKIDGQRKVIKLLAKQDRRLKTLDERYIEIERELQDKRKSQHLEQLEKELHDKAAVIDLK
jgi:parvulin-like peptidyl-prolyl isomerase